MPSKKKARNPVPRSDLAKESDLALKELIRHRLTLPPEKRLNVLRRKVGLRATAL